MFIKEADITQEKNCVRIHQTNCVGGYGSGVAFSLNATYPEATIVYKEFCAKHGYSAENLLGKYVVAPCNDGTYIIHMFSQGEYGYGGKKYTDDDAMRTALTSIREELRKEEYSGMSVVIPYLLGCVRGGGEWSKVESLFDEILVFDGIPVMACKFDRG